MAGVNIRGLFSTRGHKRVGFEDMVSHETVNVMAPVQFYDDFIGPDLVIPAAGAVESGCKWAAKAVGSGTAVGITNIPCGIVRCALAVTDEKEEGCLYWNDTLTLPVNDGTTATQGRGLIWEARINVAVIPTTETAVAALAYWGLQNAWADNAVGTKRAFFSLVGAGSGLVYCQTDDNTADSGAITSGVTIVAGDYHIYRIDASDPAAVRFYIDGVQVAKTTTFKMSTTAACYLQPYIAVKKTNKAGLGTLDVDYVRIWHNRA